MIIDNLSNVVSYQNGEEGKLDDRTLESKKKLWTKEEQMHHLQAGQENGNTPQKRGLARQPTGKPSRDVSKLSHEDSQEEVSMQSVHLQTNAKEKRILRQAQSEIQEIRKPSNVQTESILSNRRVRRLTPLEAERLQGFPDGWTTGASDSQRYKMLGNAVTVNVVYEIAKKILNHIHTQDE
jgi:site-specific DNA-cytosine methylase